MITITQRTDHQNATFNVPEDATATEAIDSFVKALQLETYGDEGIRAALIDVANDLEESINACYDIMQKRLKDRE